MVAISRRNSGVCSIRRPKRVTAWATAAYSIPQGQPPKLAQPQPPRPAAKPQRRIPAPIPRPVAKLAPALAFPPLHHPDYLGPTEAPRQTPHLLLPPGCPPPPRQPLGKRRPSQRQPADQPVPGPLDHCLAQRPLGALPQCRVATPGPPTLDLDGNGVLRKQVSLYLPNRSRSVRLSVRLASLQLAPLGSGTSCSGSHGVLVIPRRRKNRCASLHRRRSKRIGFRRLRRTPRLMMCPSVASWTRQEARSLTALAGSSASGQRPSSRKHILRGRL